eukprot:CAMPEP_0195288272 /NCGR_PEP_ID=MMETSP0707-20130614/5006_1 /TAXON_ID=33640 /ORGANISM="Asterionellopsis glacialis, Strain CCMP134" /LENGTH=56 /DNA_ID=CAMNT_0040348119 /DNA_START=68 /DNA_END=238 /DNA_ORIENTATION=+
MAGNKIANKKALNSYVDRREHVAAISHKIRVELQRVLCGFLSNKVMSKGNSLCITN